jgi:hypothetical protein
MIVATMGFPFAAYLILYTHAQSKSTLGLIVLASLKAVTQFGTG